MKLNVKNFEKWLTALRSGEYPQSKEYLYVSPEMVEESRGGKVGYCCLGVGCKVAEVRFNAHDVLPPWSFYEWLGFTKDDVSRPAHYDVDWNALRLMALSTEPGPSDHDLTYLNDVVRWDFNQIADLLDEVRDRIYLVG